MLSPASRICIRPVTLPPRDRMSMCHADSAPSCWSRRPKPCHQRDTPILCSRGGPKTQRRRSFPHLILPDLRPCPRSEEHTSELQSRGHLVCRLLLEKKKKPNKPMK